MKLNRKEYKIAERNKRSLKTLSDLRCFNGGNYMTETKNYDF